VWACVYSIVESLAEIERSLALYRRKISATSFDDNEPNLCISFADVDE